MRKLVVLIPMLFILAGCAPFEPQPRTAAPVELPPEYTLYSEGQDRVGQWWKSFNSSEVDALVGEALRNNFDLRVSLAKLKQAHAVLIKAGANLMPSLNAEGAAGQKSTHSENSAGLGSTTETQSWELGLAASYEVDLWGRIRAVHSAELEEFRATAEDLDAASVSVVAGVINTWVAILETRAKIAIVRQQININETLLQLLELRFFNGKSSALDVSQQRQSLAASKSELPPLQIQEEQLLNSLALLLGRASSADIEISQTNLPELIRLPAPGIPADILAARPDVRAAGLRLRSADWEVAAARADRLPSLTLSAQAAFSSGSLDLLFNNWFTALAASLTGPIFDGGRRKAEVDRTRAVAEQRLAEYAGVVADAILEVETNLRSEMKQREYLQLLQEQLAAARVTMKNAAVQYRNGQSDYLSYLNAWNSVQLLERKLIAEKAAQINYRVSLYRSLGGDWAGKLQAERKNEVMQNNPANGEESL